MEKRVLITDYQLEKQAKELAIYKEYNELISQPGAMATAVVEYLLKKHNLHAKSTIWFIRKRTEKRLREQGLL